MVEPAESPLQVIIDRRPFGAFQIRVTALCALVVFLDGFDTQAIGYVAPSISDDWGLGRGAMGPVFSAGLFGLLVGALVCGPMADRFGRRPVLLVCTAWFGLLSLATTRAAGVEALLVCRFLTGLGLGGAMPNAIALTSEYTPRRLRATAVMVMFCGFSSGAAVGGLLAAGLIESYGWSAVFLVGGAAPCLALPLLLVWLPESLRFLAARGRDQDVAEVLGQIDPELAGAPAPLASATDAETGHGTPIGRLFEPGRRPVTLLLWVLFFMSLLDLYFVSNWLPTVIRDAGVPIDRAVLITALFQVGGVAGTLTLGRVFDRFRPFAVLSFVYLGAAALVVLIGVAGTSAGLLSLAVLGAGVCIVGGQSAANALAADIYPAAIRATGVGWALGIGRIGSIVGPMVGAWLIALQWQARPLFTVAAIPVVVAAAAAFLIDRRRL